MQQRKFFRLTLNRCIGLIFIVLLPISLAAQANKIATIDAYVKPLVGVNQFSGVILASYQGKVIYEKAFGLAHAELGVPNKVDTVFGIASITKPMTMTIALRLIEEGKLGRQDKLSKWFPDFPKGDEISVEMLMLHRSGLPHRGTTPAEESLRYTAADMVEKAKKVQLEFKPGEQESYSSLGYSVLARVLELASGKSFTQLLQEYVFNPAGMKESTEFNSEMILPHRAQDYFLEPSGLVHPPLMDYSFLVGAGSVFSTANDVFKFGESVVNGTYGTTVKTQLCDKEGFGDNGVSNGFRCYLNIDTTKNFGFVIISNLQSGANDLLIRDLPKILQDDTVSPPSPPYSSFNKLSTEQLKEYVGVYNFGKFTNEVVLTGDKLISGDYEIFSIGKDRFFRLADYATLTFIRNADGTIKGLEWQGVRAKWEGVKEI
jgi:CubicO group peptidase (beta-lactamase class C family)